MRAVPPALSAAALLAALVLAATLLLRGAASDGSRVPRAGSSQGGEVVATAAPVGLDARARALRLIAESDTYIGYMLVEQDSVLRRWPARMHQPVRVYVRTGRAVPEWRPGMREAVQSAFTRWERVADLPMRFSFVPDSAGAEVHVQWITEFPERRTGQADIVWNRQGWVVRGRLTLAVRSPGGHVLTDDAVHTVALHEIGHLLGLGHSDQPTDVMAPTTDVHDLTMRDRNAAQLLYSLDPGSLKARR